MSSIGCLAASPASTLWVPVAIPPQVMAIKNVFRHSLRGKNHSRVRTMYSREINTPNFKQLVKTASKIVNKLSCSPSCRDHLWPITLTGLLSYRLGHVASALGNCMCSVGWRHWWHWVTHSLHSLCSSAAGRQLSDLLTDSDDSSNQSYDPNTVECVR